VSFGIIWRLPRERQASRSQLVFESENLQAGADVGQPLMSAIIDMLGYG